MAAVLGKTKVPDARAALLEFLTRESFATVFLPTAQLQEREADMLGAAIFFASGYDTQQALILFDKLSEQELRSADAAPGSHDAAQLRKEAVSRVFADLRARGEPGPH